MDILLNFIDSLDMALNTPRKRHLVGGILLSVSFLFGGLSVTSFTLKEDKKHERKSEESKYTVSYKEIGQSKCKEKDETSWNDSDLQEEW